MEEPSSSDSPSTDQPLNAQHTLGQRRGLVYFVLYQNILFHFESNKLDKEPCGIAFLEGSYCEKALVFRTSRDTRAPPQHQYCFTLCYLPKRKKYYELRAESEEICEMYCSVIEARQELKENQSYLLQILETERKAKMQYSQQTDELEAEIKKLKNEIVRLKNAKPAVGPKIEESETLQKIKKVSRADFIRLLLSKVALPL
ncbi:unnamed protein product [Schistocephalus solidus]|uniref:PH domain-containing protein n=1 Tax=Schistocephalus solidus TaxID=70667 RepID=A0A183T6F5_SCHSO|nr:unnamed protein product [Schistocephalus solidus]